MLVPSIHTVPVVTVVSEPQTVVNEGDEITIQLQRTQDTSTDTLVDLALVEYSQGRLTLLLEAPHVLTMWIHMW